MKAPSASLTSLSSPYRWGNRNSKILHYLTQITQLVDNEPGVNLVAYLNSSCSYPSIGLPICVPAQVSLVMYASLCFPSVFLKVSKLALLMNESVPSPFFLKFSSLRKTPLLTHTAWSMPTFPESPWSESITLPSTTGCIQFHTFLLLVSCVIFVCISFMPGRSHWAVEQGEPWAPFSLLHASSYFALRIFPPTPTPWWHTPSNTPCPLTHLGLPSGSYPEFIGEVPKSFHEAEQSSWPSRFLSA